MSAANNGAMRQVWTALAGVAIGGFGVAYLLRLGPQQLQDERQLGWLEGSKSFALRLWAVRVGGLFLVVIGAALLVSSLTGL